MQANPNAWGGWTSRDDFGVLIHDTNGALLCASLPTLNSVRARLAWTLRMGQEFFSVSSCHSLSSGKSRRSDTYKTLTVYLGIRHPPLSDLEERSAGSQISQPPLDSLHHHLDPESDR